MKRIVVLGVGTNIGKTWVAAALARSADPGSCLALKPIETGVAPNTLDGDAALLSEAAGHAAIPPLYALTATRHPLAGRGARAPNHRPQARRRVGRRRRKAAD